MNLPEMPIAEVIDRYTIELLKHGRIEGGRHEEVGFYQKAIVDFCVSIEESNKIINGEVKIQYYIARLLDINSQMWNAEAAIRAAQEDKLGLEEVGRRALIIRDLNRKRVAIKNEIARQYGGFEDVKVNHLSGEKDGS